MTRARDKANLTQKVTTSEPTQLTNGMLWLDTDAVAVSQQSMRWTKTPSGGTTVLSGASDTSITLSYSTGQEQVYANGVLLIRGSDYTASDGTSITLASASVAGDVFEVISIIPLTLVDTYTQAQANSAFIPKTLVTTKGDLIVATGSGAVVRQGVGADGLVLTANSAQADGVEWAAASSITLLSTTNLSGATTTVSGIPSTYTDLRIVIEGMGNNTTAGRFSVKFNNITNNTSATWFEQGTANTIIDSFWQTASNVTVTATNLFNITFNLYNYSASGGGGNAARSFDGVISYYSNAVKTGGIAGFIYNTIVDSITVANSGGTFNNGTIKIYGVK